MKFKYILLSAISLLAIVSCKQESYRHLVAIEHPYGVSYLHADQTEDSVVFYTFDNYSVTSESSWIRTDNPNVNVKVPNNYYVCNIIGEKLNMDPNTTGECRYGFVNVRSYSSDWSQTAKAVYFQYCWHNIENPSPSYTFNGNLPEKAFFVMKDSATCVVDTLRFKVHSDWKLQIPENSFIQNASRINGDKGYYAVILNYAPNTSHEKDSVTLVLNSTDLGVNTPIKIVREGLPKEDN